MTDEPNEQMTNGHAPEESAVADQEDSGAEEPQLGARARRRAIQAAGPRENPHPERTSRPVGSDVRSGSGESERLDVVQADRIDLRQGSIGSATARSVMVTQGAIGGARADVVTVTQGALGGARAQRVSVERGALGGAIAGDLRVHQGFVQAVIARDVSIQQGGARSVVANHVTFGPQSGAFLVVARSVEGGRTFVDWRGALAFGAAFGLVSAVMRHRLRGR